MTEEPLPGVAVFRFHHPPDEQEVATVSIDTDSKKEGKDETGLQKGPINSKESPTEAERSARLRRADEETAEVLRDWIYSEIQVDIWS